jgi:hypothetical protein
MDAATVLGGVVRLILALGHHCHLAGNKGAWVRKKGRSQGGSPGRTFSPMQKECSARHDANCLIIYIFISCSEGAKYATDCAIEQPRDPGKKDNATICSMT